MKLEEIIQQTPEMTEEKLLENIKTNKIFLRKSTSNRVYKLHKLLTEEQAILKEWDNINNKTSYLTNSERQEIQGLVAVSLINMTKYE